jgi:hypothetical protein
MACVFHGLHLNSLLDGLYASKLLIMAANTLTSLCVHRGLQVVTFCVHVFYRPCTAFCGKSPISRACVCE